MKRLISSTIIGTAVLLGTAAPALAAQDAPPAAERDPAALAALDKMGAALRGRTQFAVHADLLAEDVLTTGQKLQYSGTLDTVARLPNAFTMKLAMGPGERQVFYDGKTLTLFSPQANSYAVAPAPGTIKETLAAAEEQFGIYLPLSDLFRWGADPSLAAKITSAFKVGEERIGGQMCDHFAMRQPFYDWQIWTRQGDDPLPCKLVITTLSDPAKPQFSAVYDWKAPTDISATAFSFQPPAGARQISFLPVAQAAAANQGK